MATCLDVDRHANDVTFCVLPRDHHKPHDYKSPGWYITRTVVRTVVLLFVVAGMVIIGSLDSPSLH